MTDSSASAEPQRRLSQVEFVALMAMMFATNAFSIDGKPLGWSDEPYLADNVIVPTALVHGFLGMTANWDELQFQPALPPGWGEMSAELMFKGNRHRVRASSDGSIGIEQL